MVRTDDLPVALLAFLAFVVMSPIWVRYAQAFTAARPEDAFLSALLLPAAAALFLASWISTELARMVLGGLMIMSIMVMAPWWIRFVDMIGTVLVDDPLSSFILSLSVPLLILAFLVKLGRRRLVNGQR